MCAATSQVSTDAIYTGAARVAIEVARAERLFFARAFIGVHAVLMLDVRHARRSRVLRYSRPGIFMPRSIPVRPRDGWPAAARARDLPLPNSKTFFDPFFSSDSRRRRRALPVVGSRAGGQRACVVYRARSPATARGACAPRSPRIRAIRVGIPRNTSRDGARIAAEDQN